MQQRDGAVARAVDHDDLDAVARVVLASDRLQARGDVRSSLRAGMTTETKGSVAHGRPSRPEHAAHRAADDADVEPRLWWRR